MLALIVAMGEEEETDELGVKVLWMSQPQLFFLVEMSQCLMSAPVTFHLHDESLSTIESNRQKTNFQLQAVKNEKHIQKRFWNTGK